MNNHGFAPSGWSNPWCALVGEENEADCVADQFRSILCGWGMSAEWPLDKDED